MVKYHADDLFDIPLDQLEIDIENEGGETYICGNPPYLGSTWQSDEQKTDLEAIFKHRTKSWKSLDYVAGWFMKAADYGAQTNAAAAFVSTNSICQGQQVPILWPLIFQTRHEIAFAHTSFKWANLASHNAGVTVAIIGISMQVGNVRKLFSVDENNQGIVKQLPYINAYLVGGENVVVEKLNNPMCELANMPKGNMPYDNGHFLMSREEKQTLIDGFPNAEKYIKRIKGSAELIRGIERHCLWIADDNLSDASKIQPIKQRIDNVKEIRLASSDKSGRALADRAHQMRETYSAKKQVTIIPSVSSERRFYLPVGVESQDTIVSNLAFALYDAPLWNMALIASRLHLVWIATVCGKLKTDFRYSNALGWNTFPVPTLTDKNKSDLTHCAEEILLAREAHFPATIADLYDPDNMPADLREAHDRNDEVLERIYIGRRFRNDTERLEKLFELYTKMVADKGASQKTKTKAGA